MPAASLTLTSSISTDINIDDAGDFLSTVDLPVDIDHQILIKCNINSAFQHVQLSYNKTDDDSTEASAEEREPQDRYVMPDLYSRHVMYHQAKLYLKRQWHTFVDDSVPPVSHEAQVSDALQDLFDVGDKSTIQDEGDTAAGHKLQMKLDRVTAWITNFEDVYNPGSQEYSAAANNVFNDAASVGTTVPPSQCYGGAVFSEAQLRELLDACSDAGRYEWATDFPSTIPATVADGEVTAYDLTSLSGRRLKLNDGDKLAVRVNVTQKDNSAGNVGTENTAHWLVVLQQVAEPSISLPSDLSALSRTSLVDTLDPDVDADEAFLRFVNGQDTPQAS